MPNYFYVALLRLNAGLWNRWAKKLSRKANLRRANFEGANLCRVDLCGAFLHQANFHRAKLRSANFCKATLHSADLRESTLCEANFQEATLYKADFYRANLDQADFKGSNLSESGLSSKDRRFMAEADVPLFIRSALGRNDNRDLRLANVREFNTREVNLRRRNLSGTNFCQASLCQSNFHQANLSGANLSGANLSGADLSQINLRQASVCEANLNEVKLNEAELCGADFGGADLCGADLENSDLSRCDLSAALFSSANLSGANLSQGNLRGSILRKANLKGANLTNIQALNTSFKSAVLTGACIQDWNINSETNFQNVICEYIFLKYDSKEQEYSERRPHDPDKTFAPGDFANLVQKARCTVDLIFRNGINWQAFAHSIQQLKVKAGSADLYIQAIENKENGDFVIRVNVPPKLSKPEIQKFMEQEYQTSLRAVENQYRHQLQAKDEQISLYREQSTNLWEIAKLAAMQSPIHLEGTFVAGNQYNMENAKFGGGFAAEGGTQIGGTFSDSSISVGKDATGSVLQSGDGNTASL